MNTIERSCLSSSRSISRIAVAMLGALALSSVVLACAAPTDPEPNESSESTGQSAEALANNGGGVGSDGSTCESRWQSCYISCGAIYGSGGKNDPNTQQQCEDLCDEIHSGCSARAIVMRHPVVIAPVSAIAR